MRLNFLAIHKAVNTVVGCEHNKKFVQLYYNYDICHVIDGAFGNDFDTYINQ